MPLFGQLGGGGAFQAQSSWSSYRASWSSTEGFKSSAAWGGDAFGNAGKVAAGGPAGAAVAGGDRNGCCG
ncbi:MAG: hypothetical protein FJZ01_28515, partial [Candidatus Sericytochromatia bacterium]|nr:hypothetical protein [Candidatus Tanganyikabacteria bacterium]